MGPKLIKIANSFEYIKIKNKIYTSGLKYLLINVNYYISKIK